MGPEELLVAGLGPALQALGYAVEDTVKLAGAANPCPPPLPAPVPRRCMSWVWALSSNVAGAGGGSKWLEALRVAGLRTEGKALGYDVEDTGNLAGLANRCRPPEHGCGHRAEVGAWNLAAQDAGHAQMERVRLP